MKYFQYQSGMDLSAVISRPIADQPQLLSKVESVMSDVKRNGDDAVRKFTQQFDGVVQSKMVFTKDDMQKAGLRLSSSLKDAIYQAAANIKKFHAAQLPVDLNVETCKGVMCRQRSVAIERVGLYVPGGTAPLFSSVLMLGIPAVLVGCKTIVLATPPDSKGNVPDSILFAAFVAGIDKVYCVGGVQAIAAMAYGTETIPRVDKVLGPGNQFVTAAKQLAFLQGIAIDMPAGPSEVAIIANETSNSVFVAADLLSQAEHGVDSQVLLICTCETKIAEINRELETQLSVLPRKEIAQKAIANSMCIKVSNLDEALLVSNFYAPEHLILALENAIGMEDKIVNAGSVFLGFLTPESVGDYASGTNHTLPTNGAARAFSGVNTDAFMKKITFQKLNAEGVLMLGKTVVDMAENEGLEGHANAMRLRMRFLSNVNSN